MNCMDYLKTEKFPLFWCPGCGNGVVLGVIARAFAELDLTRENTVVVTGIGCWGKADDYVTTNSFHGTHGRALAFGTGIKLANPQLDVVVLMGDGDGVTIGGNHFIHAARRNVDVTAIVVNNLNYGMTGGQYSATTPETRITSTSRLGHIEQGFDICKLAEAAGAPFVARATPFNPMQMKNLIRDGMRKKGFSMIEVIAPCPTHYGKNNGFKSAPEMLRWFDERAIGVEKARQMAPDELADKIVVGKMVDRESEDYGTKYRRIQQEAQRRERGDGR